MADLFSTDDAATQNLFAGRYPTRPHSSGCGFMIDLPDGSLYYDPNFLSAKIADRCIDVLLANDRHDWQTTDWHQVEDLEHVVWQNIRWQHDEIKMYGKRLKLPRLSAWHGDDDQRYTYSGIALQPAPWNPALSWLRDELEKRCGLRFNSVLLNWYRSGEDHISWHTDAERELGENPTIGSINLGATRRFLLRRIDDHKQKIELPLSHGSLLVMSGALQHHWQHSVPKEKRVKQNRLNLTFRVIDQAI